MVQGKNQDIGKGHDCKGIKCFQCEVCGHQAHECLQTLLNGNQEEVVSVSNVSPEMHNQLKGSQGHW